MSETSGLKGRVGASPGETSPWRANESAHGFSSALTNPDNHKAAASEGAAFEPEPPPPPPTDLPNRLNSGEYEIVLDEGTNSYSLANKRGVLPQRTIDEILARARHQGVELSYREGRFITWRYQGHDIGIDGRLTSLPVSSRNIPPLPRELNVIIRKGENLETIKLHLDPKAGVYYTLPGTKSLSLYEQVQVEKVARREGIYIRLKDHNFEVVSSIYKSTDPILIGATQARIPQDLELTVNRGNSTPLVVRFTEHDGRYVTTSAESLTPAEMAELAEQAAKQGVKVKLIESGIYKDWFEILPGTNNAAHTVKLKIETGAAPAQDVNRVVLGRLKNKTGAGAEPQQPPLKVQQGPNLAATTAQPHTTPAAKSAQPSLKFGRVVPPPTVEDMTETLVLVSVSETRTDAFNTLADYAPRGSRNLEYLVRKFVEAHREKLTAEQIRKLYSVAGDLGRLAEDSEKFSWFETARMEGWTTYQKHFSTFAAEKIRLLKQNGKVYLPCGYPGNPGHYTVAKIELVNGRYIYTYFDTLHVEDAQGIWNKLRGNEYTGVAKELKIAPGDTANLEKFIEGHVYKATKAGYNAPTHAYYDAYLGDAILPEHSLVGTRQKGWTCTVAADLEMIRDGAPELFKEFKKFITIPEAKKIKSLADFRQTAQQHARRLLGPDAASGSTDIYGNRQGGSLAEVDLPEVTYRNTGIHPVTSNGERMAAWMHESGSKVAIQKNTTTPERLSVKMPAPTPAEWEAAAAKAEVIWKIKDHTTIKLGENFELYVIKTDANTLILGYMHPETGKPVFTEPAKLFNLGSDGIPGAPKDIKRLHAVLRIDDKGVITMSKLDAGAEVKVVNASGVPQKPQISESAASEIRIKAPPPLLPLPEGVAGVTQEGIAEGARLGSFVELTAGQKANYILEARPGLGKVLMVGGVAMIPVTVVGGIVGWISVNSIEARDLNFLKASGFVKKNAKGAAMLDVDQSVAQEIMKQAGNDKAAIVTDTAVFALGFVPGPHQPALLAFGALMGAMHAAQKLAGKEDPIDALSKVAPLARRFVASPSNSNREALYNELWNCSLNWFPNMGVNRGGQIRHFLDQMMFMLENRRMAPDQIAPAFRDETLRFLMHDDISTWKDDDFQLLQLPDSSVTLASYLETTGDYVTEFAPAHLNISLQDFESRVLPSFEAALAKRPGLLDLQTTGESYESFASRRAMEKMTQQRTYAPMSQDQLKAEWRELNRKGYVVMAREKIARLYQEFHANIIGNADTPATYLGLRNLILSKRGADGRLPDIAKDEDIQKAMAENRTFVERNLQWLQNQLTDMKFVYTDKSLPPFTIAVEGLPALAYEKDMAIERTDPNAYRGWTRPGGTPVFQR